MATRGSACQQRQKTCCYVQAAHRPPSSPGGAKMLKDYQTALIELEKKLSEERQVLFTHQHLLLLSPSSSSVAHCRDWTQDVILFLSCVRLPQSRVRYSTHKKHVDTDAELAQLVIACSTTHLGSQQRNKLHSRQVRRQKKKERRV